MQLSHNKILPLFWKFSIAILVIVIVFASISLVFISRSISKSLHHELHEKGEFITRSVTERAASYILYDDIVSLNKLLDEIRNIDSTIFYVIITDGDNDLVAYSFKKKIPEELLSVNQLLPNSIESTVFIRPANGPPTIIRDIAMPILDSKVGTVRVGLIEDEIHQSVEETVTNMILLIVLFLVISIIAAFLFSHLITSPIKSISNAASSIDYANIQSYFNKKRRINVVSRNLFGISDEIDVLYTKFNEMLIRLDKTHNELLLAQKSLIHSEKMVSIGTLTAGVAHEINNPIAGIKTCLSRISKNPENVKQTEEYLELIEEAILKIERVVQSLLNYSHKHKMAFEKLDLYELIRRVLLLVQHRLNHSKILVNDIADNNCQIIYASPNHLEQVILNLLINSIDAIEDKRRNDPHHKGIISFELDDNNQDILLFVSDNGVGIQESNLKNIFDPFFTTKKVGEGTGLGLSISYEIIKEHGGIIFVKSSDVNGTKIAISLPKNILK